MVTECHHLTCLFFIDSCFLLYSSQRHWCHELPNSIRCLGSTPKGFTWFRAPLDPQNCWSIAEKRDKFNNKSQQIPNKLSIPCSPWSCMVVRSHERRDKFKSANPFVHHRNQHSSFASSRVQATKIMNGFLSAEMSMNFTSGVEITPGQSKVRMVNLRNVISKSYSDLHTRKISMKTAEIG